MARTDTERREVYYSGRVQGVGFRYTVRSLARHFAVSGFVKNLPDGRVQVVVEGAASDVRTLLDTIKAQMRHYVSDVREAVVPATGRPQGFEIRY